MINIKVTLDTSKANINKLVEDALVAAIPEIKDFLYPLLVERTPIETGELKSNWFSIAGADTKSWTIVNETRYATYIEFGTKDGRKAGPRSVIHSDGRLYSSQAPGGIVRPIIKDKSNQRQIINLLEKHLRTQFAKP